MMLVTGATGNIGRLLVTQLLDEGDKVRALTRDPARADLPAGAEVVRGDFDDVDSLKQAMQGVDTVFLATYGPATGAQDANVATTAGAAGARRIVKISIAGVETGDDDLVSQWHRAGEEAIDRAGIARTFLRCGELMTTSMWWADTIKSMGKVFMPFADLSSAPVDPLDVAAVAARCLVDNRPADAEALVVTGPEVLTSRQRIERLGELLDRPVECVDVSRDMAFETMTSMGMPEVIAKARLDMIPVKSKGPGAEPSDTVETVTGQPPRTFDDWASRHLAVYR
jgi:uncharacterized protein YbjT (DUF2867 family)